MKIWYKGVLCNTGTYRYMGEDKPALYYIYSPDQETMLKAGFVEDHPCLWVKVLADEEYNEIITILNQMMDWLDNFQFVKLKNMNLKDVFQVTKEERQKYKELTKVLPKILKDKIKNISLRKRLYDLV